MKDRRRKPSTVWSVFRLGVYPAIYVKEGKGSGLPRTVVIDIFEEPLAGGTTVELHRRVARTLAKRLNECLDATK